MNRFRELSGGGEQKSKGHGTEGAYTQIQEMPANRLQAPTESLPPAGCSRGRGVKIEQALEERGPGLQP